MEDIMNRKKLSYALKLFLAMVLIMFAAQSVLAGNSNPGIAPVKSSPGGNSYAEWGAKWAQWVLGIPPEQNPLFGNDVLVEQENCPIVFLSGTWLGSSTTSLTVKPNTRFYIPMLNYLTATIWDLEYGAAVAEMRGLDPNDLTDGELIQLAADNWLFEADITEITVEIDGVPVENPIQYGSVSEPFVVEDDALGFGLAEPGVLTAIASYAIILSPMQPGEHTIFVESYIDPSDDPPGFPGYYDEYEFDVTFHVTVEPGYASACD
jgi:hypothetical protein